MTGKYKNRMLIAKPKLARTSFHHSVIYLYSDDHNGTAGFLLNWPMEPLKAATHSQMFNWPYPERVFHGGPIEPSMAHVLHTNDYENDSTVKFNDSLCYSSGQEIVDDLQNDLGPESFVLSFGHCSWVPKQLDHEVYKLSVWSIAEFNQDYFWKTLDRKEYWEYSVDLMAEGYVNQIVENVKSKRV